VGARSCIYLENNNFTAEKKMSEIKVTQENIKNVFNFTDEIVENYPNRIIGSDSCIEAGKRIADEYQKNCDEDTVTRESFLCNPRSFLKYIRPAVIIYIFSTLLVYFNFPLLGALGYASAIFAFTSQFIFYKRFLDPLFPEEIGYNVYGTLEPEGEVKQQIFLVGHHDAPYVFHLMNMNPKIYPLFIIFGLIPFFTGIIMTGSMTAFDFQSAWMAKVLIAMTIFVIPLWWFTTDTIAPGAGDNMIASALANEGTKIFADAKKAGNNALKHTRIVCMSVDAEECGLRGSAFHARLHEKSMKDTKSYVFCMDTLYNADKLVFFDRDLNMTVKCSNSMAQQLTDVATDLGYKAKVGQMPFGGGSTDAASFAQKGVEATCLLAFELDIKNLQGDLVYHTPDDTSDAIEPEVVDQALNIITNYIQIKDKEVS